MTQRVLIGSLEQVRLEEIEGTGLTQTDVRRNAVNIAHGLYHIPDAVAIVDDHRSAIILLRIADRERLEKVYSTPLNTGTPFWKQNDPADRYRH